MGYTQNVIVEPEQSGGETQLVTTNCNEIMFINFGVADAFIKGLPIKPGGTFTISGNVGEKIVNALQLQQPVSGQVWIVRKFYTDK